MVERVDLSGVENLGEARVELPKDVNEKGVTPYTGMGSGIRLDKAGVAPSDTTLGDHGVTSAVSRDVGKQVIPAPLALSDGKPVVVGKILVKPRVKGGQAIKFQEVTEDKPKADMPSNEAEATAKGKGDGKRQQPGQAPASGGTNNVTGEEGDGEEKGKGGDLTMEDKVAAMQKTMSDISDKTKVELLTKVFDGTQQLDDFTLITKLFKGNENNLFNQKEIYNKFLANAVNILEEDSSKRKEFLLGLYDAKAEAAEGQVTDKTTIAQQAKSFLVRSTMGLAGVAIAALGEGHLSQIAASVLVLGAVIGADNEQLKSLIMARSGMAGMQGMLGGLGNMFGTSAGAAR